MVNNITNEQLIKENEILSKVVLEIILRDKGNITAEQIDDLFKSADWKERTEFKLKEDKDGWWLGYKGIHSYLVRPRKPLAILKRLIKEKEEAMKSANDYFKQLDKKKVEVEKLEKELKESNLLIKELETELEESDVIIETHEAALEKAKEWRERNEKELKGEIEYTRDLLWKYTGELVKKNRQFEVMEEELMEERIKLQNSNKELVQEKQKNEELQRAFYLNNKPLPKAPSKLKLFKQEVKTKFNQFRHLTKKAKVQTQEFIAKIEIKVNK